MSNISHFLSSLCQHSAKWALLSAEPPVSFTVIKVPQVTSLAKIDNIVMMMMMMMISLAVSKISSVCCPWASDWELVAIVVKTSIDIFMIKSALHHHSAEIWGTDSRLRPLAL